MQYSKAKIFNLALGALLLSRQITNTDTDTSNENKVLNTHYDTAFLATLEDLDLNSTSTQLALELLEANPNSGKLWAFAYKYPSSCAFFRRIQSSETIDDRYSHIPKRIAIHNGKKVIFTNEENAIGEFISDAVPVTSLSANAVLAIAYHLAILSAPLLVGKGSVSLREEIQKKYVTAKSKAQEQDERESFSFTDDGTLSEFVKERTT